MPKAVSRRDLTPTVDHTSAGAASRRGILETIRARHGLAALVLCAVVATAGPARTQESAQALAARALFDEGRKLMAEARYAEACQKLEESQALRSGIGTQFNLAECHEKVGRTASAWALYLRVASETRALGQTEREEVARARAGALEPRLSRLVIAVPAPVPGLQIELDGAPMPPATWGVATPLDPGEHGVVAQAPGYREWRGVAKIAEPGAQVDITVPELEAVGAGQPPAPPAASVDPNAAPQGDSAHAEGDPKLVPYIVGGAGVASLLVSSVLGLRFLDKNGDAKKICENNPNACPRAQIEAHEELKADARGARAAGWITAGLGVVGVGLSAMWLLKDAAAPEPSSHSVRITPELGTSSVGLGVRGDF